MCKIDIATVSALRANGTLLKLFKAGIINNRVFEQMDIHQWIADKMATGINKTQSALLAAIHFKKDLRTIHRACSYFTTDTSMSSK